MWILLQKNVQVWHGTNAVNISRGWLLSEFCSHQELWVIRSHTTAAVQGVFFNFMSDAEQTADVLQHEVNNLLLFWGLDKREKKSLSDTQEILGDALDIHDHLAQTKLRAFWLKFIVIYFLWGNMKCRHPEWHESDWVVVIHLTLFSLSAFAFVKWNKIMLWIKTDWHPLFINHTIVL